MRRCGFSLNTMLAARRYRGPRARRAKELGAPDSAGSAEAERTARPPSRRQSAKLLPRSSACPRCRAPPAGARPTSSPDIAGDANAGCEVKFPAGHRRLLAVPEPVPEPEGGGRGGRLCVILSVLATLIVVGAAAWAASALGLIRDGIPAQVRAGRRQRRPHCNRCRAIRLWCAHTRRSTACPISSPTCPR